MLWLIHLSFTAFLEAARAGYIPTVFYKHHMVKGAYAVRVQHLLYGPFSGVIKKILLTLFYVYLIFVITELFIGDKNSRLLQLFTWGNMIALPFIFVSLYGRPLIAPHSGFASTGFRFSPEIANGHHMHPNTVGSLFLFAFFANMLTATREKNKLLKYCHVFYCIISVCFILIAGARGCTVCVSIALMFLFFTVWRKHLLSLIVTLLLFAVILNTALSYMISSGIITENPIVKRMSIETAEKDQGSGRLKAWGDYYRHITINQLLIGVGPLATTSTIIHNKFPSHGGYIDHPSNTYLYMLFTYGIGGFMIFMLFILKVFTRISLNIHRSKDTANYIDMGLLIGYCVFMITGYATFIHYAPKIMFYSYLISRALKRQ